jgi:Fe(3+) dicitrate transport protein
MGCNKLIFLMAAAAAGVVGGELVGSVSDTQSLPVSGAVVTARCGSSKRTALSQWDGSFRIPEAAGSCEVTVQFPGLATHTETLDAARRAEIVLRPATLSQELLVSANLIAGASEQVARIPGSVDVIDVATLQTSRVFTFEEALRKVPGVFARPEEGFGLRPNISIRGLNPTRSSRVLLLEDGVPLAYAPYGDNASYYHPPVDRFDGVEIVKGAGQILYGPMTVGGVVNYVTPSIPDQPAGALTLTGGNRDYVNAHFRYGGTFRGTGLLFDAVRKQGEGSRDNTRSGLNDFNFKLLRAVNASHAVSVKANAYTEDSRVTYSGLRLDEYLADPRQNPFRNDGFTGRRYGFSATHSWTVSPTILVTTNAYGALFYRDWWRQSSNSNERPNSNCGGMVNLNTTCGNQGRLRDYQTWGVDPRVRWTHSLLGLRSETDFGVRAHFEVQNRRQVNGATPLAREGVLVENNQRKNEAFSGFLQNRFFAGKFTITPGLRIEHVRFERTNRLFNNGLGVFGNTQLTQLIPGIGVAYQAAPAITIFAGVHRGFAPPRTEDIINNAGGFVELDPELSWNYEAGVRARLRRSLSVESTFFRLDYSNQIIPASLAGGIGATLTSAGKTLNQGLETSGRWEIRQIGAPGHSLQLRAAWTWLPVARFEGRRFSGVAGFPGVLVTGNRLPYAAGSMLTASALWSYRRGMNLQVEAVQTGRMYGDDLNTVNSTADGQRGALPGHVLWNATFNVPVETWHSTFFVTAKNLLDRTVIVDRVRGILPNGPRLVQGGLRFTF